ncbi:MBL fold metallo-hydrolase [Deinococcus aquiradiocola]|uniref:Zn-dependent hydrolase n=1 Tax=Deinococcus aquiradiocola TaxID=393059 RepID=A0A917PGV8_9DEIO|nr:MBL fold metallo-hydrolase [Deinococcus aquiradiocola]GGJ76397.1 Zn-dependent hydrolase [Deinococcus aquiradiocola]
MTWLRVTPLSAGHCLNLDALTRLGGHLRVRTYPAGFTLLHHPRHGPVLFDTGYGDAAVHAMSRWPGILYGLVTPVRLGPGERAHERLQALGVPPGDVRHVIVSHLHADHVGGLRDFPHATLHLDPLAAPPLLPLRGLRAVRRAYLPETLPPDFTARTSPLQYGPAPDGLAPFTEAADVFGDGSVTALRVPGHAPGMIALVVRHHPDATLTGDGRGLTLLASDAAWTVQALRDDLGVPRPATLAFWDARQERRSRARLHAWLRDHPHARVIVSHDAPEPLPPAGAP